MITTKETEKVAKDLHSTTPTVAIKAAEVVLEEVGPKELKKKVQKEPIDKTVFVDMTPTTPKVTFTGDLWCAMDVKRANNAIIKAFRVMLRELYRKEYKK